MSVDDEGERPGGLPPPSLGEQAIPDPGAGARPSTGAPVAGRGPFRTVVRLAEVDSTNRYAIDAARSGAPEGLVVSADLQTAGRGRLGRRWTAPGGSALLCSLLFRPQFALKDLHLLPTAVALAARRASSLVAGIEPGVKWPNDLVIDHRKLGGILTEIVPDPADPDMAAACVVVGIGVNVSFPPRRTGARLPVPDKPDEIAPAEPAEGRAEEPAEERAELEALLRTATSLERESDLEVDRDDLLAAFVSSLNDLYSALKPGTPPAPDRRAARALLAAYRDACVTIGERVRVDLLDESFVGTAVDVDDDGALLVATPACVRTVDAGDVVHLRPG